MRASSVLMLLAALLLIAGCAKPVPPEKASYVGYWDSELVSLHVTADGWVEYYQRTPGRKTESLDVPIKQFVGDNIEAGFGPLSTTIVISRPPYQKDGEWFMVVDGKVLTKR